ncbi:triphosphoribosyl-dephospho-CoA synthase [Bradyrhizobium sp. CB82]|uniref:triphosphoribosyl-dephospho-CoA synthase n=1 Tax=Bradyrhizobium sp. CB82 TaxID=3039159 RepID=UPI0024B10584|nr:triphosphoribosyl-dephospho-CoA synthase [Bradyrhizobium sp. CB82]WFU43298.1 triphosphoribosyl-dephospho-CoA synthase [Bradyrhizobium sp. CB82]
MLAAATLMPFFGELAAAGAEGAGMNRLRAIGVAAERAMLAATHGVNTHRGAIFGLGLLCAAAGHRNAVGIRKSLGRLVSERWGDDILSGPVSLRSHGAVASRRYGAGGLGRKLPTAFRRSMTSPCPGCVRRASSRPMTRTPFVKTCMRLIAEVTNTNLLHRGGVEGLRFAQASAASFLAAGGIGSPDWHPRARNIHQAFVSRNLGPGGSVDLLAMALFVDRLEVRC